MSLCSLSRRVGQRAAALWCALLSLLLLTLALSVSTQTADAQGGTRGTPWQGAAGVTRSVAALMAAPDNAAFNGADPKPFKPRRLGNPNKKENPDAKKSGQSFAPQVGADMASPSAPQSPQTIGLNWTGATLSGVNPTNTFPPDTMGAAGPTQYILAANNRIVSFNKSTGVADGVLNTTTNAFFESVRNGQQTSSPHLRYDRTSGRWILTMITLAVPNRILIAVSSESTITSSSNFTFFFIPIDSITPTIPNNCEADIPSLGIDVNALYIGTHNYCSGSFDSADGYVVRKSSVLGAGPIVVTVFRNLTGTPWGEGPYAPQGVDNYDPAATEGYFIGVSNAFFSRLDLRRVSNPATTPSISDNILLNVGVTSYPLNVRHKDSSGPMLDALDDRLYAAHLRDGNLWTAHTIGVTDTGAGSTSVATRDGMRWYELTGVATGQTFSTVQSGTVFTSGSPGSTDVRNYWMGTIMVSGQGHAAMGFSTAGTNEYANAGTVGRLASDPLGTMQTPLLYTASSSPYNPPGDTDNPRRWGEYSYTSLDPIDDMTMWTIQEFANATDSYGLQIAQLIAPPPATPSSVNQSAPQNRPSFFVVITGTQDSGSGFYDPGTNPPAGPAFKHITATVTGGVVVNSATYISPTQVKLNISTVGATLGPQSVTITNPDGQSRTGNGILTISAPTAVTLRNLSAEPVVNEWLPAALVVLTSVLLSAILLRRRRQ